MNLSAFPQLKRNAIRFEQILRVLAKYGLAEWIREGGPDFIQRILTSAEGEKLAGRPRPERVRMALAELGTTFIKLGQMMSTRPDLVGEELSAQLAHLQTDTPADDFGEVRETIESELGQPLEELFAHVEEVPLASASIAQVHQATLSDGTRVAIKVQHAGIEAKIVNDLEILQGMAGLAEKYSREIRLYQPGRIIAEFRRALLRELDFGREEQHLLQFQRNFEDDPTVRFPVPHPELSAKRVLTMEWMEGLPVTDLEALRDAEVDLTLIAKRGASVFLEMIFRDRFYHADPHPGNLLVLPDDVIGLLDCGMVGYLDQSTRQSFEGLVEGFLLQDSELLTDSALELGVAPKEFDREELLGQLEILVQEQLTGSLKDLDLGAVLSTLSEIVRKHRIVMKPGISRLIKVFIMLEGTGRRLDPEFNLAQQLEPYYRRLTHRRLSPRNLARRLRHTYREWDQLFQVLPRDLVELLRQARRGTLDVHLQHRRLDPVVNRLAYAMLGAALFLGSTLLWSNNIGPLVWGTSVPGLLGTVVSVWLGFRLLRSIHKQGGLEASEED